MRAIRLLRGLSLLTLALAWIPCLRADDVLSATDRLVRQHLAYVYGSDDVARGGVDCSGFVQIVFREAGQLDLPNEADKQLDYCRDHGQVWDAASGWLPTTLQPGDLIFYAGPSSHARASLVTHVMIYCGHGVMAGAQGKGWQIDGVHAGVGYYRFRPHDPLGILGELGGRFARQRHLFAYARLPVAAGELPPETLASLPPAMPDAPEAKPVDVSALYD